MGLADRLAKTSGDKPSLSPTPKPASSPAAATGSTETASAAPPPPPVKKPERKAPLEETLTPVEELKKRATADLLGRLGNRMNDSSISEEDLALYVRDELATIIEAEPMVLSQEEKRRILKEIEDDALGLGPLQSVLEDPAVTEIMVNGAKRIYVEKNGRLQLSEKVFTNEEQLRRVIDRIVTRVGRRVDESSPMVDARLLDGSRVNAIIPPLSPKGSSLTIRKFSDSPLTVNDLIRFGSMTPDIAEVLRAAVEAKLNILVSGGTGTGKALTHDTIIPTPTGSTTMGAIAVGDEVFDHHGKVGSVLGKYEQPSREVFEVEFNTGEIVKADADHNWFVSDRNSRLKLKRGTVAHPYMVKTTQELLDAGLSLGHGFNWQTPVLEAAIHYERDEDRGLGLAPHELPIHPYVMGLWFGDGRSYRSYLCGLVEDLESYNKIFADLGIDYQIDVADGWSKLNSGIDFIATLHSLGLMEKLPGGNKRPPEIFKYASEESRRLLLAGLLDSDGTTNGFWSFTNTEPQLVDLVRHLASSLGYKTSRLADKITTYEHKGETVTKKSFGTVIIKTEDALALLPRKIKMHENYRSKVNGGKSDNFRAIVAIRPTGEKQVMSCIQVATEDNTYLVGESFLTTHNTTLLNVLSSFIPAEDRIVTVEDAIELSLMQDHVVQLETRPANVEGKGEVSIRDLVKNSLRMRPDRIVVGECRAGEALDMLQAMNTGHDGSLSTLHSNSPRDCISRLETLVLMAGVDLPLRAIRDQIGSAVDMIVQIQRLRDGTRRITHITEVLGMEGDIVTLQDAFVFDFAAGVDETGKFKGVQMATGVRPRFSEKLLDYGIQLDFAVFDRD